MKKFFAALFVVVTGIAVAQTIPIPSPSIVTTFPDNNIGEITPGNVRAYEQGLVNLFGNKQDYPGAVGISAGAFGARCDGTTDDAAALQLWLNFAAAHSTTRLVLPAGTCVFKTALTIAASNFAIVGAGPYQTILQYEGTSTTNDMITIGNGISAFENVYLQGFRIASSTVMTAGASIHFEGIARSQLRDIVADGQDGNGNLFHGFWFDGVDLVRVEGFEARGHGDCIRVNGTTLAKADLFLHHGKIASCGTTGLRIGGNFGGLISDDMDIINNATNVSIDQTLNATGNREIFFGKGTLIDSASTGAGVEISDTGGGFVFMTGTWIASSKTNGIQFDSGSNMYLTYVGGTIYNNQDDGININSASNTLILNGIKFTNNGQSGSGFGINSQVSNPNIFALGIYWNLNASGNWNANAATNVQTFATPSGFNVGGVLESGLVGAGNGTLLLNGTTSGQAELIAGATGTLNISAATGHGMNFNDGGNGTALVLGSVGGATANQLTIHGATTGNVPTVFGTGSDTNVSIGFEAKGTGAVVINSTSTSAPALLTLNPTTIAGLPTCTAGLRGTLAFVSDTTASAAASFHGTVSGSGATTVNSPVSCNGSNWQYD